MVGTRGPCNPKLAAVCDRVANEKRGGGPRLQAGEKTAAVLRGSGNALDRYQRHLRIKEQEREEERMEGDKTLVWKGRLIDEVASDSTGEPLMLVYRYGAPLSFCTRACVGCSGTRFMMGLHRLCDVCVVRKVDL